MNLSDVADQYSDRFLEKYNQRLLPGHLKALKAIRSCRTPASGMTLPECNGCGARDQKPITDFGCYNINNFYLFSAVKNITKLFVLLTLIELLKIAHI